VLFLDEPFFALDFEMTLFIRDKLQEVFMKTGTIMLLASHDLEEAVYLADQVLCSAGARPRWPRSCLWRCAPTGQRMYPEPVAAGSIA
jgi:ABC-type nitrate/sulfonate/bicarbonate transport system ATPase subunit